MPNLLFLTILGLVSAFGIWIFFVEPNWFRLRRVSVHLRKPLAKPLRILHLSDFHFTKHRYFLSRFFDRLSRLEVDFVFVTGDLIDKPEGIRHCIGQLQKLKPKKGIYAVLGNHDYCEYAPFDRKTFLPLGYNVYNVIREREEVKDLKQALTEAGVQVLLNQNVPIRLDDHKEAVLIGIDDPVTEKADLTRAFEGIQNGALHLALVHSPIIYPKLSGRDVDIAFSGHTHGGQIRLPGIGALPPVYRLEPIIDSTHQYGFIGLVSRGMGAQPLTHPRFFCRPEALLVNIEGSSEKDSVEIN